MEKQYVLPNGCHLRVTKDGVFAGNALLMEPNAFNRLYATPFVSDYFIATLVEASWIIGNQRISLEDVKALQKLWKQTIKS